MTDFPDGVTEVSGMKLGVTHRSTFHYGMPVFDSANTLHLEPRVFPNQRTISTLVRVIPATRLRRFTDLFQNITHHFELPLPHSKLEIESRIRVENLPMVLTDEAFVATHDDLKRTMDREETWPFLQESRWVSRNQEIWRQAVDLVSGMDTVFTQATAIMNWIHAEFRYEAGATNVDTHLEEAFRLKRGVCQDFTHVMLGLCRSIGIPARYVSGYLYNGPKDRLIGSQASHAWAEVHIPGFGWVGYDPTNNNIADQRYVKVAVGRDYQDVAPIMGSYRGASHCRLEVTVTVERLPA